MNNTLSNDRTYVQIVREQSFLAKSGSGSRYEFIHRMCDALDVCGIQFPHELGYVSSQNLLYSGRSFSSCARLLVLFDTLLHSSNRIYGAHCTTTNCFSNYRPCWAIMSAEHAIKKPTPRKVLPHGVTYRDREQL